MTDGHDPSSPVQRRPEVVAVAQLGLAGADAHAHRQLQRAAARATAASTAAEPRGTRRTRRRRCA